MKGGEKEMDLVSLIPTYAIISALFLIIYELEKLRRELHKVKNIALGG
jgi:hypothetical protein